MQEREPPSESPAGELDPLALSACLEACAACAMACQASADAAVGEPDRRSLRRTIRRVLDCADVCECTARLLARAVDFDPKLLRAQVETCARACALAGSECERHVERSAYLRIPAAACRTSAERCGAVLRELPDRYGGTHLLAQDLGGTLQS